MTVFERIDQTDVAKINDVDGSPSAVHLFDDDDDFSRAALKAALAAERPLLVRGEPGVGKTQLAEAAAALLERPLVSYVVDAHTEARDLLWRLDSVRRLAEAQVCNAQGASREEALERLEMRYFIEPGPLWWGFDWKGASDQVSNHSGVEMGHHLSVSNLEAGKPENGRVVLIDEIDKADADVPNGLLEALGSRRFTPRSCKPVHQVGPAPLIIITTNEECVLPDAFVRRCLVLPLALPKSEAAFKGLLIRRGRAHFPDDTLITEDVLKDAATMLWEDRRKADPPRPGQAEFIDLLKAYDRIGRAQGREKAVELMARLRRLNFRKHTVE